MSPVCAVESDRAGGVPRASGDEPDLNNLEGVRKLCSPRERG